MAFDMIPSDIDFPVAFEPTKLDDKKYVINADTGEYLAIVGSKFNCASHGDFYRNVVKTLASELGDDALSTAKFKWRTAHSGAWTMLDVSLPSTTSRIRTDKHEAEIAQRIISFHGIDGTCSNQVYFGAIDFFCTNGMIRGDYDKVKRKNTANFTLDAFITELSRAKADFYQQANEMQVWAQTDLRHVNVLSLLEEMIASKRKAERMYQLYMAEAAVRGHNKWALYSAFTNYASYADDRNGFRLRNTDGDTRAISMWGREQEVNEWISDKRFKLLQAA
jgi:hypothetical protein